MSTTRLTSSIRDSILKELQTYAFLERAQAQIDAEIAFSVAVFEDVYGPHLDMIKAAPDGFFPMDDDFKVYFEYDCQQLNFNAGFDYSVDAQWRGFGVRARENANRRMPYKAQSNQAVKKYDLTHPLTAQFLKLKADRETLVAEISKATRTAKATLESVTTISKLIDVWPEARVFAEKYQIDGERKAILPTIPRRELNNALGLPPASEYRVAGGEVVA